jgi:UDP-N-acetylglucosamine--dolichyl-phosphate N-acetylglucosaminephosphotransferase
MLLLILGLVSFFVTFFSLPSWIKRAKETGFTGKDLHKNNKEVAELGGISVILGASVSLLIYIGLETFYLNGESLNFLLASIGSLLIATMIGMTDDMLGWRIGLSQKEKVLLTLLIPIPIMAVNAGYSMMRFPFFGRLELGLIYPLVIIPLGIIGAANGFNMLAGYNGLEAGMGVIILSSLGYMAWVLGEVPTAVVSACFVFALLAFLYYNKYPSNVFPGDVLTYPVGTCIAIVAILANLERFAAMLFFPYYIEFLLKARGKFKQESTTVLEEDSLANSDGWYSLTHVAIYALSKVKGKAREYEVVLLILSFEVLIALITIQSFWKIPHL